MLSAHKNFELAQLQHAYSYRIFHVQVDFAALHCDLGRVGCRVEVTWLALERGCLDTTVDLLDAGGAGDGMVDRNRSSHGGGVRN